jgi:hypothetical protein
VEVEVNRAAAAAPIDQPALAAAAKAKANFCRRAFEGNQPTCVHCGGPARPAILMFSDPSGPARGV